LQDKYPEFSITLKQGGSASLANTILEESQAGNSPADVFWSIDAGSLGIVAQNGYARKLPDDVLKMVRSEFTSDDGYWIGTAGRARSVPYNTNE
ncbi:MAG: extracellular solute-binding protein, partial [Halobacteria archaeon]|nr:extracellular solute-binding protein [Halobacteria archaeon]